MSPTGCKRALAGVMFNIGVRPYEVLVARSDAFVHVALTILPKIPQLGISARIVPALLVKVILSMSDSALAFSH